MSTPSHQPFSDRSLQQAQSSNDQWNGGAGAVRTPNENGGGGVNEQSRPSSTTHDSIREGKQRAKETMAAAGVGPDASAGQSGSANGTPQANGGPQLSRKRSRDGTQLPMSQAGSSQSAPSEEQKLHDEVLLDRYVQRDLTHGVAMNDQAYRTRRLSKWKDLEKEYYVGEVRQVRQQRPGAVFGPGYMGYGNRTTDGPPKIVYQATRPPPKGRRAREIRIPRKDNAQQAEQHEELVPIRLDLELDKLRLRDTFTWNLHEKLISQDTFTEYLLEDLRIPPEATHEVARQVKAEMQDQIHNFYPHMIVEDGPLEPHRPYAEHKDDEMRILIKLNITIGRITLVDQFEWDINNPLNSPEEFARSMAWENALSGEFTTAIAHSIREQSQLYTKSLYLTNHCFDGRPVEDPDLRDSFLPAPIYSAFRPHQAQKDWSPFMFEMSEAELERTETSMMREHRAQKRQLNRRGGPALPDLKERQRTVRSLVVHSVIPGAAESMEMTGITKTRRSGRAGRRAGARADGDVDSEDMDSEESGADSPAPSVVNTGTTARTRGMRGAASAAQAAMRANYGRSVTPDPQTLAVPEPRTSVRRSMLRDEGVIGDETLVVKLRIGKARLKSWWDEYRAKKRASEYPLSGYASQPPPLATPAKGALGSSALTPKSVPPPKSTPQPNGAHARSASTARGTSQQPPGLQYDDQGRTEATRWPHPDDEPPPPPPWLPPAITTLRQTHPDSSFEPIMRPYPISTTTNTLEKVPGLEVGQRAPEGVKFLWAPRLKCNDCPGKLYTALPGRVVEDFEVHLRNRMHREHVEERAGSGRGRSVGRGSAGR
ncbi:SWI/SNF chromatin-remodeling complex subunit [Saxophila tyrrhenica]|uniref:SWI/SNF chromatin-remodeling complex subunit n=1 Tax=Saxophila tyrrhenica TaxID=1690608 RepID=A0AAV9P9L6_9PEZI|nr:SWI/SNF chromatin-remodeling complex subunit [Saxophila tyrrhenica]